MKTSKIQTTSKPAKSKAYEILPKHFQEFAPVSLLLSEAASGPSLSLPLGYMLAVAFPKDVELDYRRHNAKPYVDHDAS